MHDVGKPRTRKFQDDGTVTFHHHDVVGAKMTRKRMKALRFSNDEIAAVTKLVELHLRFHGYGSGEWTDSAVRRYVRDAGDQLDRLHVLTRADCTTRNKRKADRLRRTYDDLESRIERLAEEEELAAVRPDLDGNQIMTLLGLKPGRDVGAAYHYLLELRMDHGPMSEEDATAALLAWWEERKRADGA
jgi:poly(A) polymerase